jgi:hypothetical protein
MERKIILIKVSALGDGRKGLEEIQDEIFESVEYLTSKLGTDEYSLHSLSDFMDLFNDQEIDADSFWFGYVRIKN